MGSLHALSLGWRPAGRGWRPRGFTLIELLVTVAIAAILMALGVPAMQQFIADQSAAGSADELAEGLRLARTEATKRGILVTICASSTTTSATPTCSGTTDDGWLTGWIVSDENGNLIRVQNAMRGIATVESGDAAQVSFHQTGLPSTGAATFTLTPTDTGTNRVRTVSVTAQGKVKIVKGGGA